MFTICELQQNIVTCSGTCEQCSLSILPFPSSHWKPEILSKLPSETSHTGAPRHFLDILRNILFMDFYCATNLMGLIWHHVKNHVENDMSFTSETKRGLGGQFNNFFLHTTSHKLFHPQMSTEHKKVNIILKNMMEEFIIYVRFYSFVYKVLQIRKVRKENTVGRLLCRRAFCRNKRKTVQRSKRAIYINRLHHNKDNNIIMTK